MDAKKCRNCNEIQPLESFYKNPRLKDGFSNVCKKCSIQKSLNRYHSAPDKSIFKPKDIERHRRMARLSGRKKIRAIGYKMNTKNKYQIKVKYRSKYPEKHIAQVLAARKINLEFEGAHRHHWSYNEEHRLDVLHLNKDHHSKAHRFLVYDQERKMFRTLDGELLDTKKRHEVYIKEMIETKPD